MYDSDFCGLADDDGVDGNEVVLCKCGYVAKKFVSFERYNTGRRFLACEGHEVRDDVLSFWFVFQCTVK